MIRVIRFIAFHFPSGQLYHWTWCRPNKKGAPLRANSGAPERGHRRQSAAI